MFPLHQALIGYGTWLAARHLSAPPDGSSPALASDFHADTRISRARALLGDWSDAVAPADAPQLLVGITSFLRFPDGAAAPIHTLQPAPLTPDLRPAPDTEAATLGAAFWERAGRLQRGRGALESFAALLDRYAWTLPGTLGSPIESDGISLALQFRAVAALAHVLDTSDDQVMLVEGDLSGIQDLLYTLSAKGAAKALRGRSFYLQLVADAVMRATLRALRLPAVCQLSNAGGNFRLLARASDAAALSDFRRRINHTLFDLHGGELALTLASIELSAADLVVSAFADTARDLGEILDQVKARHFAAVDTERANAALDPVGVGGADFCEVCHVDLPVGMTLCSQCASFRERVPGGGDGLARLLANAQDGSYLVVTSLGDLVPTTRLPAWHGRPTWSTALNALGYHYRFVGRPDRPGSDAADDEPLGWVYRLNDSDALPDDPHPDVVYSFRFLANTTPRITEHGDALDQLQQRMRPRRAEGNSATGDASLEPDEQLLQTGSIRNIELMARWDRTGVDRYGVLRMDIDDLGAIFRERLETPSLLRGTALSLALSRFFDGWLPRACRETADIWQREVGALVGDRRWEARQKLPYVLYSGGDDLLIVGPWDVLPRLALRLRRDLGAYVLHGFVREDDRLEPAPITMSAGIFAETAQFPLYQAADQAGTALHSAKGYRALRSQGRDEELVVVKDAVNMLSTTVSWAEFADAERLALRLAGLIAVRGAPHALLHLLAEVAREYAVAGGDISHGPLAYGRWMPILAYGLRRLAERVPRGNQQLKAEILNLSAGTLGIEGPALQLDRSAEAVRWTTMRYLNLPVRWAEFLIRKGGE